MRAKPPKSGIEPKICHLSSFSRRIGSFFRTKMPGMRVYRMAMGVRSTRVIYNEHALERISLAGLSKMGMFSAHILGSIVTFLLD